VVARGGTLHLDRGVDGLHFEARTGLWTVTAKAADGTRETFTARNVISSAPLRELVGSLSPAPISTFQARALQYRDFLTVALIARSDRNFPDNWIYIHDPSVQVGRVQNFRSWSPEMVPDAAHTCLGLEYFCFEGDGLWTRSDADLIALAKREIGQIGLIRSEDVVDACVVRQPKAYPVYDEDYKAHVATIRRDLEHAYPSLHLVGRNGMHKYNNQDHAMMTAMLTVENILAGERRYDPWCVNEDAEYTEAGVSGAQDALTSERLVPRRAA
jgi:protoporphyrinogen oxidase